MTTTPSGNNIEIHGGVHGSTFNVVNGDQIKNNNKPQAASSIDKPDAGPDSSSSSGSGAGIIILIAAIVAIGYIFDPLGIRDKNIPEDAVKTPPAARDAAVSAVRNAIQGCATETAPSPATCPQSESRATSTASVRWTLYGDPTDGEVDRFKDGTVYVMGTAIMTVRAPSSATVDGSSLFDVKKMGYYAEVSWDDKHAKLLTLVGSKAPAPESITKRSVSYSQQTALIQVKKFLNECAALRNANPAPICPAHFTPDGGPALRHPNWKIEGDPVRNARVSFNHDWGLVEVVGQLRMILYDGTTQRSVYSAPYKAQIFSTSANTTPEVLRITMQN